MIRPLFTLRFNFVDGCAMIAAGRFIALGEIWLGMAVCVGLIMVSVAGEHIFEVKEGSG